MGLAPKRAKPKAGGIIIPPPVAPSPSTTRAIVRSIAAGVKLAADIDRIPSDPSDFHPAKVVVREVLWVGAWLTLMALEGDTEEDEPAPEPAPEPTPRDVDL